MNGEKMESTMNVEQSFSRKRMKSSGTDLESVSKESFTYSDISNSNSPKKKKITNESYPWPNIFTLFKITTCIEPLNISNPNLMVKYAQDEFFETFGYTRDELNSFSFSKLSGDATSRNVLSRITIAILMGKNSVEYINLYKKDGTVLSCHVSIQCINGNQRMVKKILASNSNVNLQKWAVITIRSASVVGNSKHSGLSILGIERVSKDLLNKIGTVNSRAKTRREESSKKLEKLLNNI